MFEIWVWSTIAAAFLQNLRSLLQKRMADALSVSTATAARFLFALPFVWLLAGAAFAPTLSAVNQPFFVYCAVGGVAQILGTLFLLLAFRRGGFGIGTALSKTEAAQAALVGLWILADPVSVNVAAGIAISFVGVLLIVGRGVGGWFVGAGALYGLLAGSAFAVAAVGYRAGALVLDSGGFGARAVVTLAVALTVQSALFVGYFLLREHHALTALARAWRPGLLIGLTGAAASVGWFVAMTLVSAAKVRALGQVELIFTLATSAWFFRERLRPAELLGVALIVIGIVLLLE